MKEYICQPPTFQPSKSSLNAIAGHLFYMYHHVCARISMQLSRSRYGFGILDNAFGGALWVCVSVERHHGSQNARFAQRRQGHQSIGTSLEL